MGTLENKTANTEKHNKGTVFFLLHLLLQKTTYKYVAANAVPGGHFPCLCECLCANMYAGTSFPLSEKYGVFTLSNIGDPEALCVAKVQEQSSYRNQLGQIQTGLGDWHR